MNQLSSYRNHLLFLKAFLWMIIALLLICLFVPLVPVMPTLGLDPSWKLATNFAIANNMIMGTEFVFTSGPLAGIYTELFHPELDSTVLLASFIFVFCSLSLYCILDGNKTPWVTSLLLLFLVTLMYLKDTLFLTYPLLFGFGVLKAEQKNSATAKTLACIAAVPLGILPLVKGSFLLTAAFVTAIVCSYLIAKRKFVFAFLIAVIPIVSFILLWLFTGQKLTNLSDYFQNISYVVSGYSEAMALTGKWREVIWYLVVSLIIGVCAIRFEKINPPENFSVFLIVSLTLFVSFKAGFVRHDGHAMIAATSLTTVALMLFVFRRTYRTLISVFIATFISIYIIGNYANTTIQAVAQHSKNLFITNVKSAGSRISSPNLLSEQYAASIKSIHDSSPIQPAPQYGSYDIYSYDQAYLLATDIEWRPRPVFQSYSAYNNYLQQLNANHLLGDVASDAIFFKLQTIDNRLPALMDAKSWLPLISQYEVSEYSNGYAMLLKSDQKNDILETPIASQVGSLGSWTELPSQGPLFASLKLKLTPLGQLANLFFKPPTLSISIRNTDGGVKRFRFVSGIAEGGFLISPNITTTEDFVLFASGHADYLDRNRTVAFRIDSETGRSLFWSNNFNIELRTIDGIPTKPLPTGIELPPPPLDVSELSWKTGSCDGSIDAINHQKPSNDQVNKFEGVMLEVFGWVIAAREPAQTADYITVVLTEHDESQQILEAVRFRREDVANHFGEPSLAHSGMSIEIDASSFTGIYNLSLGQVSGNKLTICDNLSYEIEF